MCGIRRQRKRKAVAAIECAIVLPIFIFTALGIIELGRAIMVHQILTNGAREGARRAVIPGATDDQVHDIIDNYLAATTVSGHSRSITPSLANAQPHEALTVTVSVPYGEIDWGVIRWLAPDAEMIATVTMRKE